MDHQLLNAILRTDLKSFIYKVFTTLNPGCIFQNTWYIDCIAEYLEQMQYVKGQRLIINIPPRCLKSISISVAWPAWLLGNNPALRIIVASYAEHLSIKHSIDCRALMQSDWYKSIFPKTALSSTQNKKNKYMTTKFGFRMATSIGGSVTGEGADILIVDDPHNPTHIHSTTSRNKAINWFEQTFLSRLNNQKDGCVVVVMQRLHYLDLTNHLLQNGGWKMLQIPAISQQNQIISSPKRQYFFSKDTSIDPTRLALTTLEQIKKQIGSANFNAQYMQEPSVLHKGMLGKEELKFYDKLINFEEIYQSWDTAIKVNANSDYSVCTTWGVNQGKYYLIDLICQKLEYNHLKENVIQMKEKWQPKMILIEDKASGQSLIQDLKNCNIYNIAPQKPKLDKITRFAIVIPFFTLEQVLLPANLSWSSQVVEQITSFPHAKHDDIVDSISQFLTYIHTKNITNRTIRIRNI